MIDKFNVILDDPALDWAGVIKKTDFKQVLKFFRLLDDEELTDEERTRCVLNIFWDELHEVPNDEKLFEKIADFISCGRELTGDTSDRKVFCYNADHGRIYAAFMQTYKIDLRTTDMHWFIFNELLNALPDDTKLSQVIDLRGKKPRKDDSEEYKSELRKMQRAYKIESKDDAEMDSFFARFTNGS